MALLDTQRAALRVFLSILHPPGGGGNVSLTGAQSRLDDVAGTGSFSLPNRFLTLSVSLKTVYGLKYAVFEFRD